MKHFMNPQISYLADRPEWIPTLAQWIFNEWGRFDPSNTPDANQARMGERLNKDRIPLALVAEVEGSPIGCVNLKLRGMRTHPELYPWVGSLVCRTQLSKAGSRLGAAPTGDLRGDTPGGSNAISVDRGRRGFLSATRLHDNPTCALPKSGCEAYAKGACESYLTK